MLLQCLFRLGKLIVHFLDLGLEVLLGLIFELLQITGHLLLRVHKLLSDVGGFLIQVLIELLADLIQILHDVGI